MKSSLLAGLLVFFGSAQTGTQFRVAAPGYHYEFPRDYFNHPEFQTEWWYYTGNLTTEDGHRFGFELTFFRQAVDRDTTKQNAWDFEDLYLAHLALSDITGQSFYHAERTNRAGPGIAGIDESHLRIWNGNWSVIWKDANQEMRATDPRFSLSLELHSEKTPVIHGENGVSQKAAGTGHASHYISLTRLRTSGTILMGGRSFAVSGTAWMDHEFFTHQLEPDQVGWDWFSLQLNDDTELMLYRIRRRDGTADPFSSGTYIDAQGRWHHLRNSDFSLQPLAESWKSPKTGASYPVEWGISIAKLAIELKVTTPLKTQELAGDSAPAPNYWEGAIDITGLKGRQAIAGSGYLEMTGYDRPVVLGQ